MTSFRLMLKLVANDHSPIGMRQSRPRAGFHTEFASRFVVGLRPLLVGHLRLERKMSFLREGAQSQMHPTPLYELRKEAVASDPGLRSRTRTLKVKRRDRGFA